MFDFVFRHLARLPLVQEESPLQEESVQNAVNKYFLSTIQERFAGLGMSQELITLAVATVIASVVLLIGGFLVNLMLRRKNVLHPPGTIANPDEILAVLDTALVQRSKVEISFIDEEADEEKEQKPASPAMVCSLEHVKSKVLELELDSQNVEVSKKWVRLAVECVVSVIGEEDVTFYSFATHITRVKKGQYPLIFVGMPRTMLVQQRRSNLRMQPPEEFILGLAIWPDKYTDNRPELSVRKWGKPPLFSSPKSREIELVNLSASGMRVSIAQEAVKKSGLEPKKGEYYLTLLSLLDPATDEKIFFWCRFRIQNCSFEKETKTVGLGVLFVDQGDLNKRTEKIDWDSLPEEGIEDLRSWVVQRHLEQVRKKRRND